MSVSSEQEPTGPHDPLHYAPRRLRERPEPRLTPGRRGARRLGQQKRLGQQRRPGQQAARSCHRRISPPAPLDSHLESAVYESLRRPMDRAVIGEPRALARELERRGAMFGLAGRLAAAIGVSAIIALFFVIMMPASRQADPAASFSATVQSFTSALAQQPPQQQQQTDDARKPALAEFQSLLTPTDRPRSPSANNPTSSSPTRRFSSSCSGARRPASRRNSEIRNKQRQQQRKQQQKRRQRNVQSVVRSDLVRSSCLNPRGLLYFVVCQVPCSRAARARRQATI